MNIISGAEPYVLHASQRGVLLLHGFTGSPAEMRPLAEYLHQHGFTVMVPLLPGHGTTAEDLNDKSWPEWFKIAEESYNSLSNLCCEVSVIGMSMGGLLSLLLAAKVSPFRLVLLATPIIIYDKRAVLIPLIALFKKFFHKAKRTYEAGDKYNISYNKYPLRALKSMLELINVVKAYLPEVTAPLLIVQSKAEKTVNPDSANYIYKNTSSTNKGIVWLEESGHMVILDSERHKVFQLILHFLNRTGKKASS